MGKEKSTKYVNFNRLTMVLILLGNNLDLLSSHIHNYIFQIEKFANTQCNSSYNCQKIKKFLINNKNVINNSFL